MKKFLLITMLLVIGCGGGNTTSPPEDFDQLVQEVCDKHHDSMQMSVGDCIFQFSGYMVVNKNCLQTLWQASSEVLMDQGMASLCSYQRCTVSEQHCNPNNTLTLCSQETDYWMVNFYCTGICDLDGLTYTETCGRYAPGGETSQVDVCWCS